LVDRELLSLNNLSELTQMQARHDDAAAWGDEMHWQWKKKRRSKADQIVVQPRDRKRGLTTGGARSKVTRFLPSCVRRVGGRPGHEPAVFALG
jgi:hypothetical protein